MGQPRKSGAKVLSPGFLSCLPNYVSADRRKIHSFGFIEPGAKAEAETLVRSYCRFGMFGGEAGEIEDGSRGSYMSIAYIVRVKWKGVLRSWAFSLLRLRGSKTCSIVVLISLLAG